MMRSTGSMADMGFLSERYRLVSVHFHGSWPSQGRHQVWSHNAHALWRSLPLPPIPLPDWLQGSRGPTAPCAQRNNRYTVGQTLLALLYPMILGLERLETTSLLKQNGGFQFLTGLPTYPDATTLRRFLLRLAPAGPPCWSSMACRNRRGLATTRSSGAGRRITRCSASRGAARISGTASCDLAMRTRPVEHSIY